ncbi:translation elongation factor-like protein [Candidatus Woesearchaeota archaeon]|nr:translation elongation factor-like protein [Candidatus Woesearchaeota archaeon]
MADGKRIGKITHFFPKINVAVIELEDTLKKGDKIVIEGHGNTAEQTVESMEIDRKPVETAKKGQAIGMKVLEQVKEGDIVFLSS